MPNEVAFLPKDYQLDVGSDTKFPSHGTYTLNSTIDASRHHKLDSITRTLLARVSAYFASTLVPSTVFYITEHSDTASVTI